MKKNLITEKKNTTPDYYCTWQTQLYYSSDGGPVGQRRCLGEEVLFGEKENQGWANFYEDARSDLFFVMDDSWDVPNENEPEYYGSLILNREKFPSFVTDDNAESLKALSDRVRSYGWRGLGGWVCIQECEKYLLGRAPEEYWTERIKWADKAGISYFKVDWGKRSRDADFRKKLTDIGHRYAKELIIEQAMTPESIPCSDVFRTYDVPAIMSIPMTMEKLKNTLCYEHENGYMGLICCEDEVYVAASLGCTMGVMRHGLIGNLPNGNPDPSFPSLHRNLKTKITEVTRAARFHRMAPAFGANGNETYFSDTVLYDEWLICDQSSEIEAWWKYNNGDIIKKSGPAIISRSMKLPTVNPDRNGNIPYVTAAKNPNGTVSVATLGRTLNRDYFIPRCDVEIEAGDSSFLGIFGEYNTLTVKFDYEIGSCRIYAQDLADTEAEDITALVTASGKELLIPGELIHRIGTLKNPSGDTSEPGLVIKIEDQI